MNLWLTFRAAHSPAVSQTTGTEIGFFGTFCRDCYHCPDLKTCYRSYVKKSGLDDKQALEVMASDWQKLQSIKSRSQMNERQRVEAMRAKVIGMAKATKSQTVIRLMPNSPQDDGNDSGGENYKWDRLCNELITWITFMRGQKLRSVSTQ